MTNDLSLFEDCNGSYLHGLHGPHSLTLMGLGVDGGSSWKVKQGRDSLELPPAQLLLPWHALSLVCEYAK